jgi:hypothetical protein
MGGIQEPTGRYAFTDPLYLYPVVAAIVGYIAGRSRRGAFVAATLGVLIGDIFQYIRLSLAGAPATVFVGGAGVFDAIVFAGIFAVILAEVLGETRERIQGGPCEEGRPKKLLVNLRSPEKKDTQRGRENDR